MTVEQAGRWCVGLALAAVTAAAERPQFRGGVDLVYVTAVVQDATGRIVTDLKAEDFTLHEDEQPRPIEAFGRAHEPGQDDLLAVDLGMLFDTSTSMLGELKLSQQAAVRFLDAIPRARDLLTIFFDQDIRVSRYDSELQQGLIERIFATKGSGNTALYDAVAVYLSRVQDRPGRKVLVLFTDGEDSTSTLGLDDVAELLRSSGVTVYAIAFSEGLGRTSTRHLRAAAVLRHWAALTGGTVHNPLSSRDLPSTYQKILDDLSGQYVLGFAPGDSARQGYHRLKLTLNRQARTWRVRHREGYTLAPPSTASPSPSSDRRP